MELRARGANGADVKEKKLNELILALLAGGTPEPVELTVANCDSIEVLVSLYGEDLCVVVNGPDGTVAVEQY